MARRVVTSRTTYYNAWDCSSCGREGMNAHWVKQCPTCGSPKELDDAHEAEYRTGTKVGSEYEFRGVDCTCPYCGTDNEKRFSCRNCGSALDPKYEKQVRKFKATSDDAWRALRVREGTPGTVTAPPDAPSPPTAPAARTRTASPPAQPRASSSTRSREHHQPKPSPHPRWKAIALVALVACVALVVGGWVFLKSQERHFIEIHATTASWSYTLDREQFGPQPKSELVEEGQFFTFPSGAYDRDEDEVFSHTEDIIEDVWTTDGCTRPYREDNDNADGTTTVETGTEYYDCFVATKTGERYVYDTRYTWTIDEWYEIEPLTASGIGQEPVFPVFEPIPGRLRANGTPRETYTIEFTYGPDEDTFSRTMSREVWERFRIGTSYDALQDGLGRFVAIELIDPPSSFE